MTSITHSEAEDSILKEQMLKVDHNHLIQSAIKKRISWNVLACSLIDLVTSVDKSKEIIQTLVKELETLVSKVENESGNENRGVSEPSLVIEKNVHSEDNYSKDTEDDEFVENFEMYLEDEMSEQQVAKLPENFEDKYTHDHHEANDFETLNQVTTLKESKNIITQKGKNAKKHGKMNLKCDICLKVFKTKYNLQVHQRTHTGEKPYQCTTCKKYFAQAIALKTHEKIHTGEKPFQCKTCTKQFSQLVTLKTHEKYHTGERNFECDVCHKSFIDQQSLKRHQHLHTGQKPYHCRFCAKQFSKTYNLKVHERFHSGEKPFKCYKCKRAFTQSNDLTRHQRTHTGEKPYQCELCDKSYSQMHNLHTHENKVHTH